MKIVALLLIKQYNIQYTKDSEMSLEKLRKIQIEGEHLGVKGGVRMTRTGYLLPTVNDRECDGEVER